MRLGVSCVMVKASVTGLFCFEDSYQFSLLPLARGPKRLLKRRGHERRAICPPLIGELRLIGVCREKCKYWQGELIAAERGILAAKVGIHVGKSGVNALKKGYFGP